MARPDIVYLVNRYALNAPIESQVAVPMGKLVGLGYPVRLLLISSWREHLVPRRRRQWKNLLSGVRQVFPGEVTVLRTVDSSPGALSARRQVLRLFRRWYGEDGVFLVQARGETGASLALSLRPSLPRMRVVYDMRGLAAEEYRYGQRGSAGQPLPRPVEEEFARRLALEAACLREADATCCVSRAMREHVVVAHGVDRGDLTVVPCCVETSRFEASERDRAEVREELGLKGKTVLVYSGSAHSWQCVDETLALYEWLGRRLPEAHLLVLTRNADRIRAMVGARGIDPTAYTLRSVPHLAVPRHLAAGDVAVLLRWDSPVNRVASPVKFAEYLASGLPVVLTRGVGDYSELVKEEACGFVLADPRAREPDLPEWIRTVVAGRQTQRVNCRGVAARCLDWGPNLGRLERVYRGLGGARASR